MDFLFLVLAVLICLCSIGTGIFLYLRNKRAVSDVTNACVSTASKKKNSRSLLGLLTCGVISVVAILCIVISGHNVALANGGIFGGNSGIASMTEKVQAKVDDAGNVVIDKGTITNNYDVLAVGVRQVKSDTTFDLSDSVLTINCGDKELYKNNLGNIQLNDNYTTVPVDETSELSYDIKISAEKAKQLIGTSPVTLGVTFDLVVSKGGTVTDADGTPVEGAKVAYSYVDPYDQSKNVEGVVQTDLTGFYEVPNVKKGETVNGDVTYKKDDRIYSDSFEVVFNDGADIPEAVIKTEPQTSDLVYVAPDGSPNIVFDGSTKIASFKQSDTCPSGLGKINVEYRTDGQDVWTDEAPNNAGKYFVRANIDEGEGCTAKTLEDNNWSFTISKADMSKTTVDEVSDVIYTGSAHTPEPDVMFNKTKLIEGTDFDYSYSNNINAGTATINVAGKGNFAGTTTKDFIINKANMSSTTVDDVSDVTYNGSAITPEPAVTFNGTTLVKDTDFAYSYKNNTNAGTATITMIGKDGNFTGSTTKDFTINQKTEGVSITFDASSGICAIDSSVDFNVIAVSGFEDEAVITYDASSEDTNIATVKKIDATHGALQSYEVKGVSVGNTTINLKVESHNCLTYATYNISVSKKDSQFFPDQSMPKEGSIYNMEIKGDSLVTSATTASDGDVDASSFDSNVATVSSLESISDGGQRTITYTVKPVGAGQADICLGVKDSDTYKAAYRHFKVKVDKIKVDIPSPNENLVFNGVSISGFDNLETTLYSANNTEQTDASSYTASFDLIDKTNYQWSNYSSSIQNVDWTINPANMVSTDIDDAPDQSYTGSEIKPEPAVKLNESYTLQNNKDFTYSYSDNIDVGEATVTVTGKGNFTGSNSTHFTINQKTEGVSITFDASSGECDASSRIYFKVVDASGFDNADDIEFTSSSDNESTATVKTVKTLGTYPSFQVRGISEGETKINVIAQTRNCLTSETYSITVKKPTGVDPNFTPDQSMPQEESICNMVVGESTLVTSATTISDGSSIAISSNENVARVSSNVMEGESRKIVYTIEPLSAGDTDIELGVAGTEKYASDSVSFTLKVLDVGTLSPIQRSIGDQSVTFLPAFCDDDKLGEDFCFYKKNNEVYECISTGDMTMKELSIVIKEAGANNVYTDAKDARFYGTYSSSWNNTFHYEGGGHLQPGLVNLLGDQYKTVYFINNKDITPTNVGNWNMQFKSQSPLLGSVEYNTFYEAYSNLLCSYSNYPWSSCSEDDTVAYQWDTGSEGKESEWSSNSKDLQTCIVLTLELGEPPEPSKQDPQFTPDQSMPEEGRTHNMVAGGEILKTSATTVSDGDGIAVSSDEFVAKVTYDTETIGDKKQINYTIETVGEGTCDITIGVEETNKFLGATKTFKIDSAVRLHPIQYEVGGQTVTFLPAFDDKLGNELRFYYKEGDTIVEISDENMDMDTLAKYIKSKGLQNVYTNAVNTTFYGVLSRPWNDTFIYPPSGNGFASGLTGSMKEILGNNFKTVYFDNNDDTVPTSSGNWNAPEPKAQPTLGSVGYDKFYKAYNNLQEELALNVWSSNIMQDDYPYNWNYQGSWINPDYKVSDSLGVVVSFDYNVKRKDNPEFTPDANMPEEGSILKTAPHGGYYIDTVASTVSDGDVIAESSDDEAVKIDIFENKVGDKRYITFDVKAVSSGNSHVSLGVKQSDNYEGYVRNFDIVLRDAVPIQIEVDGKDVTFVPAFKDGQCPCNFYYKMPGGDFMKIKLGEETTMSSLADELGQYDRGSIYTDAFFYDDVKFYGFLVYESWEKVFINGEEGKPAIGLQNEFLDILKQAGIKTVYGDYDAHGNWIIDTSDNWDGHDTTTGPKFGSVNFSSFVDAYAYGDVRGKKWVIWRGDAENTWSSLYTKDAIFLSVDESRYFHYWFDDRWWKEDSYKKDFSIVLVRDFN